jgi:hypothetical protein
VESRGIAQRHPHPKTRAFAGNIRTEHEQQELLAMQKVEGSNPFSRSRKGLHLQVFFVHAVALFVCVRSD